MGCSISTVPPQTSIVILPQTGYPENIQFICSVTFSHATHTYDGQTVQYLHVDLGDFLMNHSPNGNIFEFGCLSADDYMQGRSIPGVKKSKVADVESSRLITAHTNMCADLVDKARSNFLFCLVLKMEVLDNLVILTLQGGPHKLGPDFNTSKSCLNLKYKSECTQMELVKSDFDERMVESGTLTYRLPAQCNPDGLPVKLYER